jgi:predicted nucleic acid-binding protein
MTRYAIDALTAIRIVREGAAVASTHQLVGPKALQSRALSTLYGQVRRGELDRGEAVSILDGITTMKIRLLGDRVSRGVAWKLAERLGWDDTSDAEFISVATLQADAFVTLDERLAAQVADVVTLAPYEALLRD